MSRQRLHLIEQYQSGQASMTELCERFGISRKTGYKWLQRFRSGGEAALGDLSRAPKNQPHALPGPVHNKALFWRRKHPSWGPRKIQKKLHDQFKHAPAVSTIARWLKDAGLVAGRPRKRRVMGTHRLQAPPATAPNQRWCMDFKGEFRLGNGRLCYPLTITDAYSRYVLCCRATPRIHWLEVQQFLRQVFAEHGMPSQLQTDNGSPFASNAPCGLTRLSAWLVRQGIDVVHGRPAHPEDNGRHERMHRTLKEECCLPPCHTMNQQQKRFDQWCRYFNHERPHQALDDQTPAEVHVPSTRRFIEVSTPLTYPKHFEVRRVNNSGYIKIHGQTRFFSEVFGGYRLGLEPVSADRLRIWFGDLQVGIYDARSERFANIGPTYQRCARSRSLVSVSQERLIQEQVASPDSKAGPSKAACGRAFEARPQHLPTTPPPSANP